jgi:hypothetical protein
MADESPAILTPPPPLEPTPPRHEVPFGVNEMRLGPREWVITLAIVAVVLLATPRIWTKAEKFETGADYRIPYALSKDYWLYERRMRRVEDEKRAIVLGDSVVWGEYVRADGTLSHFLSTEVGKPGAFANGGVNGLFPLAMEGLVKHYANAIHDRKVILHCNVLWMTSPKVDLSTHKEEQFNHSRLVPQFDPWIPAYRADAAERLSVVVEEHVQFSSWVGHLQNCYYDHLSIPQWTLEDDGGAPPKYPNAWRNPLSPITMEVPGEPENDPERGPSSARHVSWVASGHSEVNFDWVPLEESLQWQAFRRVTELLRKRGNDVLVVVGPFNEYMVAKEQRPTFLAMRAGIVKWLGENGVPYVVPQTLPSELYADSSHPLTAGYKLLAKRIADDGAFKKWYGK